MSAPTAIANVLADLCPHGMLPIGTLKLQDHYHLFKSTIRRNPVLVLGSLTNALEKKWFRSFLFPSFFLLVFSFSSSLWYGSGWWHGSRPRNNHTTHFWGLELVFIGFLRSGRGGH